LISGIVGSKSSNLPAIAAKLPGPSTRESRIKKLSRWVHNESIDMEVYFLPYADALLSSLAPRTLVVAVDGSAVGRNCVALMASVIYQKRALPIAWLVVPGKKGHLPEEAHVQLLEHLHRWVPQGAT